MELSAALIAEWFPLVLMVAIAVAVLVFTGMFLWHHMGRRQAWQR